MYAHLCPPLVRLVTDCLGVKVSVGVDVRADVRGLWAILDPWGDGVGRYGLWGCGICHGRRMSEGGGEWMEGLKELGLIYMGNRRVIGCYMIFEQ